MHFKGQYQFFKSAKKITMEKSKLNLLRLFETPKQEIYVTTEASSRVVSRALTNIKNVAQNEVEIND
uniref:Uncharacterized protein n=1 Tax=Megaselia scalaris TaxID=36166 RepID=T1H4B3_MEGSC